MHGKLSDNFLRITRGSLEGSVFSQFLIANDHGELRGGENFYDRFYPRDGAYQVMELEEAGLFEPARQAMEHFLKCQDVDGRFHGGGNQVEQLDANGQVTWALWQYARITGDRQFLERAYKNCEIPYPFDYHVIDQATLYYSWSLVAGETVPAMDGAVAAPPAPAGAGSPPDCSSGSRVSTWRLQPAASHRAKSPETIRMMPARVVTHLKVARG